MKDYRSTLFLAAAFLVALVVYWALERAGVPSERERLARAERVIPQFMNLTESGIARIELERDGQILAFEPRDPRAVRWNLVDPLSAAADSSRIISLARNLIGLRRSPDSGALDPAKADFGLSPPSAVIRVWRKGDAPHEPAAVLEIGRVSRGSLFVKLQGAGVDVVDANLFTGLDDPLYAWREKNLIAVPTFQVARASIQSPSETIKLQRTERGIWKLSEPVAAIAETAKVENLLAAMAALRVEEGEKGFVADDVKDFKPYGLDPPAWVVELETSEPRAETLRLEIGKHVPDHPEQVYVRQGGHDDVVIVAAKPLGELPETALALRSKRVSDFDPARVTAFEIEAGPLVFAVTRQGDSWMVKKPTEGRADSATIAQFLRSFSTLEASEIFKEGVIKNPQVNPGVRVSFHEADQSAPSFVLKLGRHDPARKAVYSQLEKDSVILVIADRILESLPQSDLGFRDLEVATLDPVEVRRMRVRRGDRIDEVEPQPARDGTPNEWRMIKPVKAKADAATITRALTTLRPLRASALVAQKASRLSDYGLEFPGFVVEWETDSMHSLRVGNAVKGKTTRYAILDSSPMVFTLDEATISYLAVEYHDHTVMSFPPGSANHVTLEFQGRTVKLRRRTAMKGTSEWVDEPGQDTRGLDLSRVGSLVSAMSKLETTRFLQYEGLIPAVTGLIRPRLTVTIGLVDAPPRILRIGDSLRDMVVASTGRSEEGSVFVLPAPAWEDLIRSAFHAEPFPSNVFAP